MLRSRFALLSVHSYGISVFCPIYVVSAELFLSHLKDIIVVPITINKVDEFAVSFIVLD